ncbi:hypothetical protein [Maribacter sp. 2-571]|uniref:hypothetical protein n=1 Tax=Maribacter sp. 2-571 TaxID=3417569 RepID=UPI003D33B2DA
MKALLTFIFFFVLTATSFANVQNDEKVATITMDVVLTTEIVTIEVSNTIDTVASDSIARLYRRENSKVLKALSFSTKRSRAKMA